jgi:hypothetical protein
MISPDTQGEPLPPLYAGWLAELLGGPIPRESRATCDNCVMAAPPGADPNDPRTYYFDPVVKCCTYIPDVPNFLVGRVLSDDDPAAQSGRVTVEKRIRDKVAVTPLGLGQPAVFSTLYNNTSNAFGRSHNLRCPHFIEEGGRCGIWRSRNSVCTTWFCKHVRGDVAQTLWRGSILPLLGALERDLSRWCVLELQIGDEALRHLTAGANWRAEDDTLTGESIDNRVDERKYGQLWGPWRGRESEFFKQSARLVEGLSWNEVLAIGGPKARANAQLTKQAYGRLASDDIPAALIPGKMQLVQIQHETSRVNTYNEYDPLDVPSVVMAMLHCFDGRPTEEAVASIAARTGIQLDPSLLRKMVDFALLVEPERPV